MTTAARWTLCLLLAACGPPATTRKEPPMPAESNEWRRQPGNDACRTQLRAFRDGRFGEWTGLRDCHRVDVEAVLGESEPGSPLLPAQGEARDYRPQGVGRNGFVVWFQEDVATAILANDVELRGIVKLLGPAEHTRPSQLVDGATELVYASRGLSFQADPTTRTAFSVNGFAPMSVDAYFETPLGGMEVSPRW